MTAADLDRVLSCLATGEQNAVTTEALIQRTGLDRRTVRRAIHDLRLQGVLICSRTNQGGGYWIAADTADLQRFVRSMDRRAKATFAAVRPARRIAKAGDDQTPGARP